LIKFTKKSVKPSAMYWDSLTNSATSALVPTWSGSFLYIIKSYRYYDAASLTTLRMFTQAGRSFFKNGWTLGLLDIYALFLSAGPTIADLPPPIWYTNGFKGYLYLSVSYTLYSSISLDALVVNVTTYLDLLKF
jgi:hypothetical protein